MVNYVKERDKIGPTLERVHIWVLSPDPRQAHHNAFQFDRLVVLRYQLNLGSTTSFEVLIITHEPLENIHDEYLSHLGEYIIFLVEAVLFSIHIEYLVNRKERCYGWI